MFNPDVLEHTIFCDTGIFVIMGISDQKCQVILLCELPLSVIGESNVAVMVYEIEVHG